MAYNIPVEKIEPSTTFCRKGRFNLYSMGIGRTMIMTSVTMFKIACQSPHWSKQIPVSFFNGLHGNWMTREIARVYETTRNAVP